MPAARPSAYFHFMSDSTCPQHPIVAVLLGKARHFRAEAGQVHPVVARAYLRHASELELTAWVHAARSVPIDIADAVGVAAA